MRDRDKAIIGALAGLNFVLWGLVLFEFGIWMGQVFSPEIVAMTILVAAAMLCGAMIATARDY